MSNATAEQLFRQAAIAEDGMTASAGARVAHVRLALESGRAITIDLSQVPEHLRSALVAKMREMAKQAATESQDSDQLASAEK